jgi:PAS domain S-box-containing protein
MKNHAIKVQTRLIYSFLLLVLVFLSVFISFRNIEKKSIILLFEKNAKEKERVFDKLLKLRGASLGAIVFDYTYWDEILAVVAKDDKSSANMYVSPNTLSTYDIDGVWIYNIARQLYYSVDNFNKDKHTDINFPPAVFDILFQKRFAHFFFQTPAGLMEIHAATIHPTKDVERKTEPQGYFFAGRLWDDSYIKELSELTDSRIQLRPWANDLEGTRFDLKNGLVTFSKDLNNWENKPFKQLVISRASEEIKEFNEASKKYFLLLFIFAVVLLVLFISIIISWVFLPLYSISAALRSEDLKYLRQLKEEKTEFGDIARLIFDSSRQKEEIQRLYKMTRDMLGMAPFGIYVVNEEGGIDYVNPAMLEISGDTAEQFKGLCIFELPVYKETGLSDKIKATFEGESFHIKSLKYTSQLSKKTTVRNMSGMPFKEEGRTKALIFVEDVSERENLEQMKTSLIQMIVHDLNNPLAGILGNAQVIQMELGNSLSEEQKNSFYWIMYGVQEMQNMISNLLDINKMEEGKFNLRYEEINLNVLFDQVVNMLKVVVQQEGKVLCVEAAPDLVVRADREILKRVISNLIGNALKFTPAGSQIKLEARYDQEGRQFVLGVKDQGMGIPEEYLSRVFDKFVQVEAAQTGRRTGKGLGLTFCKMAVEAHGGKIWVESEVGKGTTFYFTLPVT